MNKKELLEQLCKLNSTEPLNLTEKTYDFLKKEDLIEIIPKQEYVARLNSNDEALNKTDAEYKKISHELEDCKSTIQNWPQNKKRLLITEKRKAKEQNNERIILYWKEKQPELEATLQQTKKSLEALLDKQSKLKLCTKTNYGFTMISDKGKKCLFFLERNTLDNSLNIQEMNETLAIYNFIEVRYTRFKETYDLLQQKGFEATPAVVNLALSASALKDEPKAALERITKISYFLESKDFKEKKNNIKLISALIPINYADLHVMLDDWHKSVEIAITGWSNCYNTYIEMAHAIKIKDSTPTKRFYQTELMTHSIKKRGWNVGNHIDCCVSAYLVQNGVDFIKTTDSFKELNNSFDANCLKSCDERTLATTLLFDVWKPELTVQNFLLTQTDFGLSSPKQYIPCAGLMRINVSNDKKRSYFDFTANLFSKDNFQDVLKDQYFTAAVMLLDSVMHSLNKTHKSFFSDINDDELAFGFSHGIYHSMPNM